MSFQSNKAPEYDKVPIAVIKDALPCILPALTGISCILPALTGISCFLENIKGRSTSKRW
mgnify:CR=1 FL=1